MLAMQITTAHSNSTPHPPRKAASNGISELSFGGAGVGAMSTPRSLLTVGSDTLVVSSENRLVTADSDWGSAVDKMLHVLQLDSGPGREMLA